MSKLPVRRAANDAEPFDGVGAGDWGDPWAGDRAPQPPPPARLAELFRRLEPNLARDRLR